MPINAQHGNATHLRRARLAEPVQDAPELRKVAPGRGHCIQRAVLQQGLHEPASSGDALLHNLVKPQVASVSASLHAHVHRVRAASVPWT